MKNLSPAIKAVITAIIMIAASLLYDKWHEQLNPNLQYFIYLIYLVGIVWTLIGISGSFGQLFATAFRHFIVVTIFMVSFTFIFIQFHPELAEQEKAATIRYYQEKGDKTPLEIEDIARKAKKQYALAMVSISIFRYLIIGAAFSAGAAAFLSRRK
ncbi:MAG: DUF4199 family protein [Chitinophagaceae bacterium]|nr:DUF4199 family protein [Chitinophagaceae bacterium]